MKADIRWVRVIVVFILPSPHYRRHPLHLRYLSRTTTISIAVVIFIFFVVAAHGPPGDDGAGRGGGDGGGNV